MKELLKSFTDRLPHSLGRWLSNLPMDVRLGRDYTFYVQQIKLLESEQREQQLYQINKLIMHAWNRIPFYQQLYKGYGCDGSVLMSGLQELHNLPIVSKADMQKVPLCERSESRNALKKSNTGGTSGQPLEFYLEKSAYAREWAHMQCRIQRFSLLATKLHRPDSALLKQALCAKSASVAIPRGQTSLASS